MNYSFLIVLIFIAFTSCVNNGHENNVVHPTKENIIDVNLIDNVISDVNYSDSLRLISKSKIGIAEGDVTEMLGAVTEVELDTKGYVYVLETEFNEVRVYNEAGQYYETISKSGAGPGELLRGMDLEIVGDSLFIADANYEIELFRKDFEKNSFVHEKSIELTSIPLDIEVCDGKLFVSRMLNFKKGAKLNPIFVYDAYDGEFLYSFGDVYKSGNILTTAQLTKNKLVCNENSETLVVMNYFMPYLKGYSLNGDLKWISKIDDFKYKRLEDTVDDHGRKTFVIGFNKEGYSDHVSSLISIWKDSVVLQLKRMKYSNGEKINETNHTYLIDASTGEGKLISKTLPILMAANIGFFAGIDYGNGYPQISILEK